MKNNNLLIILGPLSRAFTYVLILFVIAQIPSYAAESLSLGEKADAMHYSCEIVSIYSRLHRISNEYGEILINESETTIFHASAEAANAFEDVRNKLRDMYVPENMKEPHAVLTKSVSTYIESARSIEKALGIYVGVYEGSEEESLELINESERQVVLATKYLSESLEMHDNLLAFEEDVSKSCRKTVAGLSY